jgi:DNA-binding CsgD family transcriptional regulator
MKLFVGHEKDRGDILATYIEGELQYPEVLFTQGLPCTGKGYSVSLDGKEFSHVEKNDICKHPVIEINQYYDDDYCGVNQQGISLLAFEVNAGLSDELEIKLGLYPSYVSVWNNKVQITFRLEKFIPKDASEWTKSYLPKVISDFEIRQHCTNTDKLINPFCDTVQSYVYAYEGLSLKEIQKAAYYPVSAEHKKLVRGNAGRAAAKVRWEKSEKTIRDAIQLCMVMGGKKSTQTEIAKMTGLSRKTVNEHWKTVMSTISPKRDEKREAT